MLESQLIALQGEEEIQVGVQCWDQLMAVGAVEYFHWNEWTASGGVFWGVCELIMILGSLSANGWGCVPVLLVVWHGVSSTGACWLLSGSGFSIETEISGRALANWHYVGLGGLWWTKFLNSFLPPQRLRPNTHPEHQDPVSHTAGEDGLWVECQPLPCCYSGSVVSKGHPDTLIYSTVPQNLHIPVWDL